MKICRKIILLVLTISVLFVFSCKTNEKKNALIYNYSIINVKKSDLLANATDLAAGMMRDTMLSKLKGQAALDMFRKDKVKLVYVFKDMEGKDLFVFDFKHTEY